MINSIIDTDLYKLTMGQFAFHLDRVDIAEYKLICRSNEDLRGIARELRTQINEYKKLRLTKRERQFLESLNYFKSDYLDFLENIDLKSVAIKIECSDHLEVHIKGDWKTSILFEVPVLAMIQELQFKNKYNVEDGDSVIDEKIDYLKGKNFKFIDFGTRRRISFNWHKHTLMRFRKYLAGTSNVFLAMDLGLKPVGTMAHEYFQAYQAFVPDIMDSQKVALEEWIVEYPNHLRVALTDIFTMDKFLLDFSKDLISKYDGVRHDSGDPELWADKMLKIFGKEKTLVFSDGLTLKKAVSLYEKYHRKINVSFGIGTHITNDFEAHSAMSLVIKMIYMNGKPVIKVSDEPIKTICESEDLKKYVLRKLEEL